MWSDLSGGHLFATIVGGFLPTVPHHFSDIFFHPNECNRKKLVSCSFLRFCNYCHIHCSVRLWKKFFILFIHYIPKSYIPKSRLVFYRDLTNLWENLMNSNQTWQYFWLQYINFFSVCERAEFNKSCNLIGSGYEWVLGASGIFPLRWAESLCWSTSVNELAVIGRPSVFIIRTSIDYKSKKDNLYSLTRGVTQSSVL